MGHHARVTFHESQHMWFSLFWPSRVTCAPRMPEWTETNPLRVVTGYHNVARKFFSEQGFEHVVLLSADGALEAAPLMGTADIILDLVRA